MLNENLGRKEVFTLHPILLGVLCLMFISTITGEYYQTGSNEVKPFSFARVAGGMVGILLYFVAPSWVAWRIMGRRRKVANVAFVMMAVLMIGGLGTNGFFGGASSEHTLKVLHRERVVLQQRQLELTEKMIAGEEVEIEIERNKVRLREIDLRVAGLVKGGDGQAIRIIAEFKQQLSERRQVYDLTLNEFFKAGGLELDGADDDRILAKRLKLLASCGHALDAIYSDYLKGPDLLRVKLEQAGVADNQVSELVQDLRETAQLDLVEKLLGYEQSFIRHSQGLLRFLGDHKDRWKIDERTEEIQFDNHDLIDQFNGMIQAIQLSIHEETKLRQEMVERARKMN